MNKFYRVNNVLYFVYDGEYRLVRIEKVKMSKGNMFIGPFPILITGYDYTVGEYRSFKTEKIKSVEIFA